MSDEQIIGPPPQPFQVQRAMVALTNIMPKVSSDSGLVMGTVVSADYANQTCMVNIGSSSAVLGATTAGPIAVTNECIVVPGKNVWLARVGSALIAAFSTSRNLFVDDSTRNPILTTPGGNETRGNGVVSSWYAVQGGECHWWGHYQLGTTTSWPGASALELIAPVAQDNATWSIAAASQTGYSVRGFNGAFSPGTVEASANLFALRTISPATAAWTTTVPFTWGSGNILSWDFRYRIAQN